MDLTQINIFNMTKGLIDRDSSLRCFEKYYKNLSRLWFRGAWLMAEGIEIIFSFIFRYIVLFFS